MSNANLDDRKESCKSYLEQTKLLVTLASAFLLPPAFIYTVLQITSLKYLLLSEACFVASVLFGYVVFGSITGSQRSGNYDVYRPATRVFSLLQIVGYLAGLIIFVLMCLQLDTAHKEAEKKAKVRDLQSTILHLTGLDARKLKVPYQGLDQKLIGPANEDHLLDGGWLN